MNEELRMEGLGVIGKGLGVIGKGLGVISEGLGVISEGLRGYPGRPQARLTLNIGSSRIEYRHD